MVLTVRNRGGTLVECGGQAIMLDPTRNTHTYPTFVTHAHADHASAFKHPERVKFATQETFELLKALRWRGLDNFHPIKIGESMQIDDFEIKFHNSGHVLGSVQIEVNTPEGTVLYTGDICTENTYTMKPATPVKCDILVIETTFGSPIFSFPKRHDIALEMVRWSVMDTIKAGKIPTFKTDSIGNAQEIISIYNQMTNLPVVTSKSATLVTNVYKQFGYKLDAVDAKSSEGIELLDSGKCILITPKGSKPIRDNLETALASGWATILRRNYTAFPLSDHADYKSLLGFIRKCRPKRVLTFHGGNMTKDFHSHVKKVIGISATPLTSKSMTIQGPLLKNENRINACSRKIIRTIRIPGFVYKPSWLINEMKRHGFTINDTKNSIEILVDKGILTRTSDGVILINMPKIRN